MCFLCSVKTAKYSVIYNDEKNFILWKKNNSNYCLNQDFSKDKETINVGISGIGFDFFYNQALVEINLPSIGFYDLLEKENGKWTSKKNTVSWIE